MSRRGCPPGRRSCCWRRREGEARISGMPEPLNYSPAPRPKKGRQAVLMVVVGVTGFLWMLLVAISEWPRLIDGADPTLPWFVGGLGVGFLVIAVGGVLILIR